ERDGAGQQPGNASGAVMGRRGGWLEEALDASGELAASTQRRKQARESGGGGSGDAEIGDGEERGGEREGAIGASGDGAVVGGIFRAARPGARNLFGAASRQRNGEQQQAAPVVAGAKMGALMRDAGVELRGRKPAPGTLGNQDAGAEETGQRQAGRGRREQQQILAGKALGAAAAAAGAQEHRSGPGGAGQRGEQETEPDLFAAGGFEPQVTGQTEGGDASERAQQGRDAQEEEGVGGEVRRGLLGPLPRPRRSRRERSGCGGVDGGSGSQAEAEQTQPVGEGHAQRFSRERSCANWLRRARSFCLSSSSNPASNCSNSSSRQESSAAR